MSHHWNNRRNHHERGHGSNPANPQYHGFFPQQSPQNVLFPSAFASTSTASNKRSKDEEPDEESIVAEQLFPPGKVSDLQKRMAQKSETFIGMEYMIEIQHNTIKKMANSYSCLLCDTEVKVKKDPVDTVELAKNHLKSNQHKLKYLTKFFPTIKNNCLEGKAETSIINSITDRILQRPSYAQMKIKIVIGMKLFKRKSQEIKSTIENSTHLT